MLKDSYAKLSIEKYLDYLAAKMPVPGGGSAASLVGSVAIALLLMVINFTPLDRRTLEKRRRHLTGFTHGKKEFETLGNELKQICANLEDLKQKFINLIDQDIEAYKKLDQAYKRAKNENREISHSNIQQALKEAIGPPLQACKYSHQAFKLSLEMLNKTNKLLISDLGIGVWFLKSVFESSLFNIQINLSKIDDDEFIISIRKMVEPLEEEIEEAKNIILDEVNRAISKAVK